MRSEQLCAYEISVASGCVEMLNANGVPQLVRLAGQVAPPPPAGPVAPPPPAGQVAIHLPQEEQKDPPQVSSADMQELLRQMKDIQVLIQTVLKFVEPRA